MLLASNIGSTISRPDQPTERYDTISLPAETANIISSLILSDDKLFFIRTKINEIYEWNLIQINLQLSLQENPSCVTSERFIAEFYQSHPKDAKYSHINRRFWKEYHRTIGPRQLHDHYHLIKPNENEATYAKQNYLVPFRKWLHITDKDTYIHGPFNFATYNNRKSSDRVDIKDWKILQAKKSLYSNSAPNLVIQPSFHINTPYHSTHQDSSVSDRTLSLNSLLYLE